MPTFETEALRQRALDLILLLASFLLIKQFSFVFPARFELLFGKPQPDYTYDS